MKRTILYIVLALVLIAIVAIRLKNNKETIVNRVYHYDKEQAINVQSTTLKLESIKSDKSYTGTFDPDKETKVSADIQGKINSVLVDGGSKVKKGDPLIQLDNTLLKYQLQTVDIQIEGLEADVKRFEILANADAIQGIQLEKAGLGLRSAQVQKATLIEQINKTTIRAPFNGIVTAKITEVGAFAAPGIPLLQITDISNLKFTVNVAEDKLDQFNLNQLYSIKADVYPEIELSGKVIMVGSKSNMGNSYPVQFSVKNTPELKIKSGMFGQVNQNNLSDDKFIIIPASSIVGTNIQPQVYTIINGKAILKNITVSSRFEDKAVISDGLTENEVIIINGFINLFDGANVIYK
jgi:membrane fusion protein, multidrug efflux system